jgi:hypothetical protein
LGIVLALALLLSVSVPAGASARCSYGWKWLASSKKDPNSTWAPGVGFRAYAVSVASYVTDCGSYVRAEHNIYIDTRAFPYGWKFWLSVSSRRSDGVWRRVKKGKATIFEIEGHQKIQEIRFRQKRYTPGRTRLTRVHVRHTASTPSSGAIPTGSTAKAKYQRYYGPEAKPKD